jgi:RNase H-fold protein (predicted Holliday junction resolvase)
MHEKLWFCGLDISKYRVGIATSCNKVILPFKTIPTYHFSDEIIKIKKQYQFKAFIIGIPHPNYHNFAFIKHFTHKHRHLINPFIFQDEDYSTILSTNILKKKQDDVAACVILESFFLSL